MFLRNLNQSTSGKRILGTTRLGVFGSEVSSTGQSGPPPLFNDNLTAINEYRCELLDFPSAGTFFMWENSNFIFSGAPDGQYIVHYRLWENGVDLGTASITLNVGSVNQNLKGYKIGGVWYAANVQATGYKINNAWKINNNSLDGYKTSGIWGQ